MKLPSRNIVNGVCLDRLSASQLAELAEAAAEELNSREFRELEDVLLPGDCAGRLVSAAYNNYTALQKSKYLFRTWTRKQAANLLRNYVKSCWVSRGRHFVEFDNGKIHHFTQSDWMEVNLSNSVRTR